MPVSNGSRTTGAGLWTDANQMLSAARLLATAKGFETSQPLFYLLGHSLELSFKSYVRAKGGTLECLKSMGHDLELCLAWALTTGLADIVKISEKERAIVSLMNIPYKAKEFEYRVTGHKRRPQVPDLIALTEKILKSTREICVRSARGC